MISKNGRSGKAGAFLSLGSVVITTLSIQGLSFLSSILVIRSLSVRDYALFSITNVMAGVLSGLADSGLSTASLTLGGRYHGNRQREGALLATCRRMLHFNGLAAFIAVAPFWLWSSWKHSESAWQLISIGGFLFLGFFLLMGANVYRSFLLLHHKLQPMQACDVCCTVFRAALMLLAMRSLPTAGVAVAVGFFAEVPRILFYRWVVENCVDPIQLPSQELRREIMQILKRTMPTTIYGALSSQVQFLLLSLLGSSNSVAGAGALSRLNQVFMIVPSFVTGVLNPRLAREKDPLRVSRLFVCFALAGVGLALAVSAAILFFPEPFLWLLGHNYAHYQWEARMVATASLISCASSLLAGLQASRGSIVPPVLTIGVHVVALAVSITLFSVDQLRGFLWMQVLVNGASLLVILGWSIHFYRTLRSVDAVHLVAS